MKMLLVLTGLAIASVASAAEPAAAPHVIGVILLRECGTPVAIEVISAVQNGDQVRFILKSEVPAADFDQMADGVVQLQKRGAPAMVIDLTGPCKTV